MDRKKKLKRDLQNDRGYNPPQKKKREKDSHKKEVLREIRNE
jgi:hypothetical protein